LRTCLEWRERELRGSVSDGRKEGRGATRKEGGGLDKEGGRSDKEDEESTASTSIAPSITPK
jgi:hypothetical protein